MEDCVFCTAYSENELLVFETSRWWVRINPYPVTEGHLLIISKRHIGSMMQLNLFEWTDLLIAIKQCWHYANTQFEAEDFNLGLNDGPVAGQTIGHTHFHFYPRYSGDVENPRGGINNFKKPIVEYPEE